MILNKKILRTIAEHKSRYMGSMILIWISCLLFASFTIAGPSMKENIRQFKAQHMVEDASFLTQTPVENLSEWEETYQVLIEERKSLDYAYDSVSTLRLVRETEQLNLHQVVQGEEMSSPNHMLIDEKFAKAHQLAIGDSIQIYEHDYLISGMMTTPDYLYMVKSETDLITNADSFGLAILPQEAFQNITQSMTFYSVKFTEANRTLFQDNIHEQYGIIQWVNKEDNGRISFINGDINGFIQTGKALPIAILILTCALIAIVLWRLVKGEFTHIGTLYALGYRKKEILMHYLSYPFILAFTGSILGTISGIFLATPLLKAFDMQYNLPLIELHYNWNSILLSLLLPFALLIPTSFLVVFKALRLSPLVLMRGGGEKTKVGFIEKKLNLKKLSFDSKFKIREMVRNVPRTLLLIVGVALASMLLLFGFATKDSIDYVVEESYMNTYQFKYQYTFNSFQLNNSNEGEKLSFSAVELLSVSEGKDNQIQQAVERNTTFTLNGIEKGAQLFLFKNKNGEELSKDQVIMTKPLADKLNMKPGDSITVKNKLNGQQYTLEIEQIADTYIGEMVYMPLDEFNALNQYPENSYLQLISSKPLELDASQILSTLNKDEMMKGYEKLIEPVRYFIGVIALMAFIIGLIIIYIVTSMIIEENKTNISLLKILGYPRKKIYALVLNSNTLLVLIGFALSIPLIYLSLGEFFKSLAEELNLTFPVVVKKGNILLSLLLIMGSYEVSKWLSKRKIHKIPMVDILKNRAE